MAFIGKEDYFPLWLPQSLADDLLTGSSITLLGTLEDQVNTSDEPESPCGYIIRDWFGPYLLSPSSRYLKGRC